MKHLKDVSKQTPAKALLWGADHPNLKDSFAGLFEAPLETVRIHLKF